MANFNSKFYGNKRMAPLIEREYDVKSSASTIITTCYRKVPIDNSKPEAPNSSTYIIFLSLTDNTLLNNML